MKIEITKSEFDAVLNYIRKNEGEFKNPCCDCDEGGVSECEFASCKARDIYENLKPIYNVLCGQNFIRSWKDLEYAEKQLKIAQNTYNEKKKEVDKAMSFISVLEDQ